MADIAFFKASAVVLLLPVCVMLEVKIFDPPSIVMESIELPTPALPPITLTQPCAFVPATAPDITSDALALLPACAPEKVKLPEAFEPSVAPVRSIEPDAYRPLVPCVTVNVEWALE